MDLAGLVILLIIAALAAVTSIQKLVHPQPGWVALAALVGFADNELVGPPPQPHQASHRVGGPGQQARADGFTSLAVLLSVGGSLLGSSLVDPIVGLLITVAILAIVGRLLDAIDLQVVVGGSPGGSGHR